MNVFVVEVFSGLVTLRKLCNHPDLITNDYSELVAVGMKAPPLLKADSGEEWEEDFDIIPTTKYQRKKKKKKKDDLDREEGMDEDGS